MHKRAWGLFGSHSSSPAPSSPHHKPQPYHTSRPTARTLPHHQQPASTPLNSKHPPSKALHVTTATQHCTAPPRFAGERTGTLTRDASLQSYHSLLSSPQEFTKDNILNSPAVNIPFAILKTTHTAPQDTYTKFNNIITIDKSGTHKLSDEFENAIAQAKAQADTAGRHHDTHNAPHRT